MSTKPWQVTYQEGEERTQEVPPVSVPHPLSHPAGGSHQTSRRLRGKSGTVEGSRTALSSQGGCGLPPRCSALVFPHSSLTHISSKYCLPTSLPTWALSSLGEGSSVNQRLPHRAPGCHMDPALWTLPAHPGAVPGTGHPRSPGAWPPPLQPQPLPGAARGKVGVFLSVTGIFWHVVCNISILLRW